jgi:DNA-binding MarR family transcriptional regulator
MQSPLAPSLTLDSQLCFALYTASLAMTKAYKAALERFDLTYPQYLAMLVLWEHDELSVKDLAARLGLDSATLTPILKRLESVGYVRRVRGVLDERLVLIHLTENGQALKLSAAFLPDHISEIVGRPVPDLQRLRDELHDLKASLAGRMRM